jgi:hypothetical protein
MKRQLLILTAVILLLTGLSVRSLAAEMTVRGRLARTVEAGGWLIQTSKQKYLLLNFQRFQNEKWFAEGTEVEAIGEERRDTVSVYQEGIPFEVRTLRPFALGASDTGAGEKRPLTRILVTGEAIMQAQPDTAIVIVSVVTQDKRALDAQQQNATLSERVVSALKAAAGTGAEVKTSGYSLQPQRVYKENQPPTITGYEARNLVTVTMSDLTKVGAVIDAATAAGANNVESLSFTLRQDQAARDSALSQATRVAVGRAHAIAQALGGRVMRILEVQEATATARPLYQTEDARGFVAKASAQTPIEVGSLDIRSQVQLIAEVETEK